MRYVSTRDGTLTVNSAEAIAFGLSPDGGLYTPSDFPHLALDEIQKLCAMNYRQRAAYVLKLFLGGLEDNNNFNNAEITGFTESAYNDDSFRDDRIAPLHKSDCGLYFLELWHGPTCAFKDMALQILPYLLTASLRKLGEKRKACILVATSGDTGKAALEGFRDVAGTKILVFYPREGVSHIQKLQMTTQEGENVGVCAVDGNFDDAQSGIKSIFADKELSANMSSKGLFFSSANSINWGRLLPQIVYYISSYCELLKLSEITLGEHINFCVPTGNFGNILAAYFAKKMGLPINKLICASNTNNVLTDFFETGIYNRNRPLLPSISPSMDILISSNLERLLFDMSGKDSVLISEYMQRLSLEGSYRVNGDIMSSCRRTFASGYSEDMETKQAIRDVFNKYGYLIDTHTAAAYDVYNKYRQRNDDDSKTVIISTASPYKFCGSVLLALGADCVDCDEFSMLKKLNAISGVEIPESLNNLQFKKERFLDSVEKNYMKEYVTKQLRVD